MINMHLVYMLTGLVTVEWPKSIEGKYLRISKEDNE